MMSHFQQNDINKIINRYKNINKVLSALQMLYIVGNNFITVFNIYLSLFYENEFQMDFPKVTQSQEKVNTVDSLFFQKGELLDILLSKVK